MVAAHQGRRGSVGDIRPPPPERGRASAGRDGLVSATGSVPRKGGSLSFGIGACDRDPRGLVQETSELVIIAGSVTSDTAGCNFML